MLYLTLSNGPQAFSFLFSGGGGGGGGGVNTRDEKSVRGELKAGSLGTRLLMYSDV